MSTGIDTVYSNGIGSKRSIAIEVPDNINIKFSKGLNSQGGLASANHILSDGITKEIKVEYKCPLLEHNLFLSKGYNFVVIEWPVESNEIKIYKVV